jgi:hypothetical protein
MWVSWILITGILLLLEEMGKGEIVKEIIAPPSQLPAPFQLFI